MRKPRLAELAVALVLAFAVPAAPAAPTTAPADARPLARLKVSDNRRFLVREDGSPFFYLGDTAWELFHRLNREEADRYLKDRAARGFTVIQAVAIAELDGHVDPNPYGHLPLTDLDPDRPAVKDGPDNDYWDHVDYIVDRANSLGLYIGFLPTWGRYWHDKVKEHGDKPLFTPQNAETYGEWLGRRYKDKGIIWILGGDRKVDTDEQKETIRAMARGLRKGDGGSHLMTFHPRGGGGSAEVFHGDDWLDFNMRQNGHVTEYTGRYDQTRVDYDRNPPKPVLDGEPIYEDHPVSFNAKALGHSIAADVRRPLYWDLFSGACGHTYGHHSVWQMWQAGRNPINNPLMPWQEALKQPGADQMQYGRRLIESRPFLTRIPDDSVIVTDPRVPTSVPGAGRYRFVATRDEAGTYAMVYAPVGRPFSVHMDVIKGVKVKAWWFNPRNGEATPIDTFPNTGTRAFFTPDDGEMLDWVLVLDDAAKGYPPPGKATKAGGRAEGGRLESTGRIPVLAWGGPPADQATVERFKEMADAGFTMSYSGFPNANAMAAGLGAAKAAGVQLLVACPELANDPEGTAERFKDHPAIGGYFLTDEPSAKDFPRLAKWVLQVQSADGGHPCYINLFPDYATDEQLGTKGYQSHLDRFVAEVPVPVLSFDHYPVVGRSLRPEWYANLEAVAAAAKAADKPFWAFALSVKHFAYPTPELAHLRVQVFSDLAYGAQAIQYFTYWSPNDPAFGEAPIGKDGKRTAVYDRVRQVNEEVRALSGVFLGSKVVAVGHTGEKLPAGTRPFRAAVPVREVTTDGTGAVVSLLENNGRRFLVVVNRDITSPMPLRATFDRRAAVQAVSKDGTLRPVSGEEFSARVEPGDVAILSW